MVIKHGNRLEDRPPVDFRVCIDLNLEPCVHMCVLNLVLCVLYHCKNSNCATLVLYISASIALLYVQLSFRG